MTQTLQQYQSLRLILGDQLNRQHSWYREQDPRVLYVIAELHQEAGYVVHHIQKLCSFFAAMADFAKSLQADGHQVSYLSLDDTAAYPTLSHLISALCARHSIEKFDYQAPDEFRLAQQLESIEFISPTTVTCYDSEHFLLPQSEIPQYINAGKHNRMESFYRKMRKRFNLLMAGDEPRGERWNFDGENRQKLKAADLKEIPEPLLFNNDVRPILVRIERHGIATIGNSTEHLLWPINHEQADQLLHFFCRYCLPNFGRFQDAMTRQGENRWSLYHSRISFALNSKLLHPMEVIETALRYFEDSDDIDLAQIEGFVRQILGWREYIRGVYWANMPGYAKRNELDAQRDLPDYFWTGKTNMACMQQAIDQSLDYAYAHHIQRLMVTGNFAMLAGIHPDQMDQWYLGIYIDAIEWVEMPNTRGMSQFADGGLVATKPYAASGSYINKMSDYCGSCQYSVKERFSEKACPFNSLYWHFMQRHTERFARNPRTAMAYRSWDKMDPEVKRQLLARADYCLENLEKL
ncbi:MAG: cryptochrome/photolyase family protein [Porticoccaceae bacterium]|nr:cryptochrome/photolyase family protein [Porticoccaceae bacterium]